MKRDDRLDQMRRAVERDAARRGRAPDRGSLLRAMGLIGSVGWPIALLTAGGALLGHCIDGHLGSGVSATLTLLSVGAVVGTLVAARALREGGGR